MKVAVILLLTMTLVAAAPQKRILIADLLDGNAVRVEAQKILNKIGSDGTEKECEKACLNVVSALVTSGCDFFCKTLQATVQRFHLVPETSTATSV